MLLGFKDRFVPFVLDGSKTHTIRAKRKNPFKVGKVCDCYTGLRHKGARLLGRWPCVKVEDVVIYQWAESELGIKVDGVELTPDEMNALAWRDGFRPPRKNHAWKELTAFWLATHRKSEGPLDFYGDIIHWSYKAPVAHQKPKKGRAR